MLRAMGGEGGMSITDVPLCPGETSQPYAAGTCSNRDLPNGLMRASARDPRDHLPLPLIALRALIGCSRTALSLMVAASCSQLALQIWEAERIAILHHAFTIHSGRGSRSPPRPVRDSTGDGGGAP